MAENTPRTIVMAQRRRRVEDKLPEGEHDPEIRATIFGQYFNIRNYDIVSIVFCGYVAATCYIFWQIKQDTAKEHQAIVDYLKLGTELQAETNYINSLPIGERPPIPMPDSLHKRLYGKMLDDEIKTYDETHKAKSPQIPFGVQQ